VSASWRGFVDRESGLLFYRYVFGDRCFNNTEFQEMTDASKVGGHAGANRDIKNKCTNNNISHIDRLC